MPGDQPVHRLDVHLVSQVLSGSAWTVVYRFALTLKRNFAFMPCEPRTPHEFADASDG